MFINFREILAKLCHVTKLFDFVRVDQELTVRERTRTSQIGTGSGVNTNIHLIS